MKSLAILVGALVLSAAAAWAEPAELEGVVVRADGRTLYFDLGKDSGIREGSRFEVRTEGAELRHPKTGESLGPIIEKKAEGAVKAVEEKYSTGRADAATDASLIGLKVRVFQKPAPAASSMPEPAAGASGRRPTNRSPVLKLQAIDIAAGDLDGDGEPEVVVAAEKEIRAYPYAEKASEWQPVCVYKSGTTGARAVSVEAADLDGDGRAEVFASFYNAVLKQGETAVLSCEAGILRERTTLPWLVRAYTAQDGTRALAVQQIEDDRNFPLTRPFPLEFRDGRYSRSRKALKPAGVEWIYGFAMGRGENGPLLVDHNSTGRLRVRFLKGSRFRKSAWTSSEPFGQTAERVKWHGETLRFRPSLFLSADEGGKLSGVYALRNVPRMLGLASAFGIFSSSELIHLRWNGLGLEPSWKAAIQGYSSGLAKIPARGDRPARLLVAVVGGAGSTSVWTFDE